MLNFIASSPTAPSLPPPLLPYQASCKGLLVGRPFAVCPRLRLSFRLPPPCPGYRHAPPRLPGAVWCDEVSQGRMEARREERRKEERTMRP